MDICGDKMGPLDGWLGSTEAEHRSESSSQKSLRRWRVADLMQGDREIVLEHNGQDYHLRVTSNGKLILTK